jgi:hypothetical protein
MPEVQDRDEQICPLVAGVAVQKPFAARLAGGAEYGGRGSPVLRCAGMQPIFEKMFQVDRIRISIAPKMAGPSMKAVRVKPRQ